MGGRFRRWPDPAWRLGRWPLLLAAGVLLSACGPRMEWVRPSTTVAQRDGDLIRCGRLAYQAAQQDYWWRQTLYLNYPWPYGGPYYAYRLQPLDVDEMMEEQRLTDFCMRSLGYRLQPVQPAMMPPSPPASRPPPRPY